MCVYIYIYTYIYTYICTHICSGACRPPPIKVARVKQITTYYIECISRRPKVTPRKREGEKRNKPRRPPCTHICSGACRPPPRASSEATSTLRGASGAPCLFFLYTPQARAFLVLHPVSITRFPLSRFSPAAPPALLSLSLIVYTSRFVRVILAQGPC